MPLIKPADKAQEKEAWRIRLQKDVTQEIISYCEWADIKYRDYFIEQACKHIFAQDEEWQAHKAKHGMSTSPETGQAAPEA